MLLAIILLGLILRVINLGQSFWLDEAAQLVMSQKSISWIWFDRSADFHPPLFYFLTHFWLNISHAEPVLRLLPVIPGLLSIPAIYLLTFKLFSKKIANYSALFLAINPYLVYYSQEMRSYSLMLFLAILSMYCLVSRQYLWLFIVNVLLIYTHYSSFLFILTQIIYLKRVTLAHLLLPIAYIPWLPMFIKQLSSGVNIDQYLPGWRAELTLPLFKSLPLIFFKFVAGRIDLLPNYFYLIYIVLVIASTFLILYLAQKSYPILTIWLVMPIFLSLALSFFIPQTQPFRLIFCLPPILIYFAVAAYYHAKKVLTILLYIFIVGNFMQISRPRLQREQWRQVTAYLNSQNLPVIVKFPETFAPLVWYKLNTPIISAYPKFTTPEYSKFVLFEYLTDLTDPNRQVENKLINLGYRETSARDFPGVGIIREYSL